MIESISHLTFIVSDLDKMENLLVTVLDAEKVYDSQQNTFSLSAEKFFIVGGHWLAIMEGDSLSSKSYNHIAFKINRADFAMYLDRIQKLGLELREDRKRVEGEGSSIYFYDYDNHLFELHTGTLQERLQRYSAGGPHGT
ncbi:MAG: FosX/FosE/FosI family fosfomycin resistance hydrolase [Gammaproteobacteria bacterium]|nr:FosX/FosE/FosI family fosfomycin resistance hydrolase [Gammaproteobacteria bacterium]